MGEVNPQDPRVKFLMALEKKKKSNTRNLESKIEKKIQGSQTFGNSPKMFRRKSGSA